MRCKTPGCGSYAINHGSHGRDGSDGDLCDVCYWRKRANAATAELAAMRAGGEPVANSRPSLEAVFRGLSDRAYCNYIEQMRRDVCLGWEYKAAHGKFGELELKGHVLAAQQLGRHKAFMEAANAIRGSDAPLTHPQPAAQDVEDAKRYQWLRDEANRDYVEFDDRMFEAATDLDSAIDAAITAQQGEKS